MPFIKKGSGKKDINVSEYVRQAILLRGASLDEIREELKKKGVDVEDEGRATTIRAQYGQVVQLLREMFSLLPGLEEAAERIQESITKKVPAKSSR